MNSQSMACDGGWALLGDLYEVMISFSPTTGWVHFITKRTPASNEQQD